LIAMLASSQVGRFEVRDFLGRGAIGDVYLAWDPQQGREVALKVVRTRRADPDMLEAEKKGAELQKKLARVAPQVADVFEEGCEGELFWVAMEYIDGRDLSQVLAEGRLTHTRAIDVALQLCAMLEVCHQFADELGGRKVYGVVHGDIKPENIRLQEREGRGELVRVLDFGIAKHLSQTRRFTVNLFGSLPYTPPERLDRGGVDRHSDLWAVGVVLYLMVSGELPFAGDEVEEVERKIRDGVPPEPLPGDCPTALQHIVQRSLAFDASRRYPAAADLRADLEAFRDGRPLPGEDAAARSADLSATRRTAPPAGTEPVESPLPATPVASLAPMALPMALPVASMATTAPPAIDATRRTERAAPASEAALGATRRTIEPDPELPPPAPPPVPEAPDHRPRRRLLRGVAVAAALGVAGASQIWVKSEAREIRHQLAADPASDLDRLADRYRGAARLSLQGWSLGGAREELRTALVKSADRILDSYHGDAATTTEHGWQTAYDRLRAAIDLDLDDRSTRAKMRYCHGHLLRIAAQALRVRGQGKESGEKLRDAAAEFREAAQLAPEWPDPYLGLSRFYAYDSFDFEQLKGALEELRSRGYPSGRRETAMLADGNRMHAAELKAQADALRDSDREAELLQQARDRLDDALTLYREIPTFANARGNRAKAAELRTAINSRLVELGAW
jgi:serine/threonine-protein kinase